MMMSQSEQGASWVKNEDGTWQSPNEGEEVDKKENNTKANVYSNRIGSLNKLPSDGS
tara:strand:- start:494 stop:664 length:171 start_codon:yes stop_codon:yes gene_type:complete